MSVWQMPQAASLTSTSPAFGSARSTSVTLSGCPNSSRTAARIRMRATLSRRPSGTIRRVKGALRDEAPTVRQGLRHAFLRTRGSEGHSAFARRRDGHMTKARKRIAALMAAGLVVSALGAPAALAGGSCEPPPKKQKCNSGRGNGSEGCDPGNSSTSANGSTGQNQGGDEGGPIHGGTGAP
jgi:hypothetical protein